MDATTIQPLLPWGQIALMAYTWISIFVYIIVVYIIITKRPSTPVLRSSFFDLVLANAISDFLLFFHIEFFMRPRKYRFFNVFNENTPTNIAYISYSLMILARSVTICGFLPVAANRYTAFTNPLEHNNLWTRANILKIYIVIWIFSILCASVTFFSPDIRFTLLDTGILQMISGWFTLYDSCQGICITIVVTIICLILYLKIAFKTSKSATGSSHRIEQRLLICSILMFLILVIEGIRACAQMYSKYSQHLDIFYFATEAWFYVNEILCSIQCWTLIFLTSSVRRPILAIFIPGMRRKNDVTSVVMGKQSQSGTKNNKSESNKKNSTK